VKPEDVRNIEVGVKTEIARGLIANLTAYDTGIKNFQAQVTNRSSFSSSATYSPYLVVDGYHLLNTRIGFRAANGWTVFVWSRNLLDKNYFELLTTAPGNTGLYVGQPGDGRTAGITLRVAIKNR
jgi:outer membrane receptor protein involved in Fe transport